MSRKGLRLSLFVFVLSALIPSLVFAQGTGPATTPEPEAAATEMMMEEGMMPDAMMMGIEAVCAAPSSLSGDVTIGAVFTLSGGASVYGVAQRDAVELAVEQINSAAYLGEGVTFNVIFQDSASENEQAIAAMTTLIDEDQVVAVLGPTLSREAFSADPIAQEAGIPVMGVSNTAIGITDMGDFVFRNSLPEAAVIPGVVEQATTLLSFERVGLLYANDDDFTVSGFEVMRDAFEANGVENVGEETYATGDVDFNAQLTNLLANDPDVLAVSALAAEAVQIIIQARSLGFTGNIIGGNGFNSPAVLEQTGADSEGLIVGGAWNIDNPTPTGESVGFVDAFESAYNYSPDQFAAQAYTGAWLMANAIRCADSVEPTAIRDALAATVDYPTPLGVFSFDENRDPLHDPIAQIVRDGAFTVLTEETGMME